MKKILSMIVTLAMLLCVTSQLAFASPLSVGEIFDVIGEFNSGNTTVDYGWTNEDYTVSARYSKGAKYVEQPYIDDSDNIIKIKVKATTDLTASQTVDGVVTIYDKQERKRYTKSISFPLKAPSYLYLNEVADKEFTLPGSYGYGVTRFYDADSRNKYGTLNAEFIDDMSGNVVAYFDVKIAEQGNRILTHSDKSILDIVRKNESANVRFIKWETTPKFDLTGTLGMVMESDEYLYKVGADNKLTAVSGTYNKSRGTFDFKTDTLASYAISDAKLSGAGTASSTAPVSSSVAASVAPAPAPAPSSKPPVASSVAPAPAPSSSSSEPVPEPSSSEPEPVPEPSSSEPEPVPSSSSTATVPDKDKDKGGFPVLPVAIGLGVVVVGGVAAYFIFNNRSGGKKNYDSWDD